MFSAGIWYVKGPLPYSYNPYSNIFEIKSYIEHNVCVPSVLYAKEKHMFISTFSYICNLYQRRLQIK